MAILGTLRAPHARRTWRSDHGRWRFVGGEARAVEHLVGPRVAQPRAGISRHELETAVARAKLVLEEVDPAVEDRGAGKEDEVPESDQGKENQDGEE